VSQWTSPGRIVTGIVSVALLVALGASMTGTQRAQSLGLTQHGALITAQDAGAADAVAAVAVTPGTAGQVLTVSDAGLPHWAAASGGTAWGSTTVDPLSGTGWTTTPESGVTVTWSAGTALTLAADAGTTGLAFVTRDATPLGASSTSWEIAVRLDVTAGDGMGAPRGFFLMGFYVDASNYSLSTLRSDRNVGMFTNVAGSTTNVGETTGPSSGDLTGGQFWLRHSRTQNGQFIAWWGVGVGGALPTTWRQLYTATNTSLMTALPTTSTIYVGSGAYGEGAIASPWTVEVLAIRMTSVGSL
jgi:hypothetical protein